MANARTVRLLSSGLNDRDDEDEILTPKEEIVSSTEEEEDSDDELKQKEEEKEFKHRKSVHDQSQAKKCRCIISIPVQPGTSLEEEVYAVLHGSKFAERSNHELSVAEEEALKAMSVEEARERRKELQKMRALQSYYEAKCRRQKKIKSKKYHRIQRKAHDRSEKKQLEELERVDPTAYERLTLKHKNTGKWAKGATRFGKHNPQSVQAINEQLQKNKDLTTKISATIESDDEEEEEKGNGGDWMKTDKGVSIKPSLSDINNPWFAGEPKIAKKKENDTKTDGKVYHKLQPITLKQDASDASSDSEDEQDVDSMKPVRKVRFFDEQNSSDDEVEIRDAKSKNLQPWQPLVKRTDTENGLKVDNEDELDRNSDDEEIEQENKNTPTKVSSSKKISEPVADEKEEVHVDPTKFFEIESRKIQSEKPDFAILEDDADEDEQRITIQQAFADDDVVSAFSKEKLDKVDKDKPKNIDLSLPGWGDWGGSGIVPNKRKKKKSAAVNQLPFPFTNAQQFERSIRQPVGQTWNPESTFKKLTKPKVSTKMGSIIAPITSEEAFEDKSKTKKGHQEITESGQMNFTKKQTKNQRKKSKGRHQNKKNHQDGNK
uniref:U3 small nucleolar RNA-associated protein 14 homolog B-like n=1 Tax=Saccoglossus kowalevskii TaxID=10224 RepID=A0ABM0M1W7_SACKO|nr:PREDICTED: U3 small nucleolar RNA-associated protein 14 homolog B-like [Saccoglossus kowalevskii]